MHNLRDELDIITILIISRNLWGIYEISSFSCSFQKNIGQIIGWHPRGLAPPPLENPGSTTAINRNHAFQVGYLSSGGSKGGASDPPSGPKFLHFHAVFGKIGQIIGWRPPPLGLVPSPLENPGSATAFLTNTDL